MMLRRLSLTLCFFAILASSFAQTAKIPFKVAKGASVILDTDMGNDIDDALALDMLFKYMDQGKLNLIGIMNNKGSDYSTRFLDLFSNWYGYPNIPIGQVKNGVVINDYVDYAKNMVEYNNEAGNIYPYARKDHEQFLESHKLYRKLLAAAPNNSVIIISVGFSTNLHRLLISQPDEYSKLNGRDLVAKKVNWISIMGGSFGEKKRAEFNIIHDIPAARYVFDNWPTKIALSPFEVGAVVSYPSKSIVEDFKWVKNHPLVDAYKRYRKFPYNRSTWDLTSVYYVGEPNNNLLDHSPNGTLNVDEKGFMFFTENKKGKHRVLSLKKENEAALKQYFVDLIKQKPKKLK